MIAIGRALEGVALDLLELLTQSWVSKRALVHDLDEKVEGLEETIGPDEVNYRRKLERELGPIDREFLRQPRPEDAHPALWELRRLKATGAPTYAIEEALLITNGAFGLDVPTLYEMFIDGGCDD